MAEYISRGTEFHVDKAGNDTFTKIGQVRSIDWAGRAVDIVEFMDLDMTSKRREPGLPDPGALTLELNYDPGNVEHLFLEAQADAPDKLTFQLKFTQTSPIQVREFEGFVSGFDSGGGENSEPLPATVNVQVSGAITKTTETPPGD